MALTVSELQTARDGLLRARAQGVRAFRDQNGETAEFKSDGEMARALAALDAEIAAATRARPSTIYFSTTKGL